MLYSFSLITHHIPNDNQTFTDKHLKINEQKKIPPFYLSADAFKKKLELKAELIFWCSTQSLSMTAIQEDCNLMYAMEQTNNAEKKFV